MRVLIADDHAILRRGLKEILVRELDGVVCEEAETADEVLQQIDRAEWDLLILDITMRGRSGLDVLRELKERQSRVPVLVLSMHDEEQYGRRVLRAGAAGFMSKESAPEELIKAIRKIVAGGRYITPSLAEKLVLTLDSESTKPVHETLSGREFEVLRLLGSGKTVGQIAELLSLSDKTVSTYRARILLKLNLQTTAELIRYVLENKLLD